MEEKFFFKFSYADDEINIFYTSFRNKTDDFFPGMKVNDYFYDQGGYWVIDQRYNLEYIMKCFDEPERLVLIPCGFDNILCLEEDKEKIQSHLWEILKRLKNENCFFWTGDMMLDMAYDPTNFFH